MPKLYRINRSRMLMRLPRGEPASPHPGVSPLTEPGLLRPPRVAGGGRELTQRRGLRSERSRLFPDGRRRGEPFVLIRVFCAGACAFGGCCWGFGAVIVITDAGGEKFRSWTSCPAHYCLGELPVTPQSCCLMSRTQQQESINTQAPWLSLGKC